MPIPTWIGELNKKGLNRITRRFAGRMWPFAIVVHRGRKSGQEYRTPLMAFPHGEGFTIALTYGPKTDWVKNVMVAGSFHLVYRGRDAMVTNPRLVGEADGLPAVAQPFRAILRLLRVHDFLLVDRASDRQTQV